MFKTPELLQTEPDGSPADDVVFPLPSKIALNEAFTVLPIPHQQMTLVQVRCYEFLQQLMNNHHLHYLIPLIFLLTTLPHPIP